VGGVSVRGGFRHSAIRASISDTISDLLVAADASIGFKGEVVPYSNVGVGAADAEF